jgi:hypothetical protein
MTRLMSVAGGMLALAGFLGCSSQSSTAPVAQTAAPSPTPSAAGAKYRLDAEPAGARNVADVRAAAVDGEKVVVVGRIGGDVNPWVEGRAAFTIVDLSLQACSDIPGDSCPTPWDYCCATDGLKTGSILVKVVDEGGQLVADDARTLLGVAELDTLVVEGTLQKGEEGNATVLASHVFVRAPGNVKASAAEHGDHAHEGHDHDADKHEHKEGDAHEHEGGHEGGHATKS